MNRMIPQFIAYTAAGCHAVQSVRAMVKDI